MEEDTFEVLNSCDGNHRVPYSMMIPHERDRQTANTFEVLNPATETLVSIYTNAGVEEVDEAVNSARAW